MENKDAPATRDDLDALEERLTERLTEGLDAQRDQLIGFVRDVETHMLKAFYSFAETNTRKLSQAEANNGALA